MKLNKDTVFISLVDEKLIKAFFEEPIEFNLELALFCLPEILNENCQETIVRVKKVFEKYPVKRHLHGPCMDLIYNSRDAEVRALARRKIEQGIVIAGEIGAKNMVVHSTFNPLIVEPKYPDVWIHKSTKFFKELVPIARECGVTMAIENIFDFEPSHLKCLIEEVNAPEFKGCLDIGHANIFGNISLSQWVAELGEDLVHVHVHDNQKVYDDHIGLGAGTIDFKSLFNAIDTLPIQPAITLELKSKADLEISMHYLKDNGYWEES